MMKKIAALALTTMLFMPLAAHSQSQTQVTNICGTVSELVGPVMNLRRKGDSYQEVQVSLYVAAQGDSMKEVIGQTALDIVWNMSLNDLYERSRRDVQQQTFHKCLNDLSS